jgi:hypothetical protein
VIHTGPVVTAEPSNVPDIQSDGGSLILAEALSERSFIAAARSGGGDSWSCKSDNRRKTCAERGNSHESTSSKILMRARRVRLSQPAATK